MISSKNRVVILVVVVVDTDVVPKIVKSEYILNWR